jgi:magnesium transporter
MNDIINIKGVQWTHVVRPDIDLIQSIAASYDLHDLIIEDVNEARTQDKIDQYDDHLFLVLHFPKYDTDRNKYFSNEFNIILGKDFLISLASADTRHIDNIRHDYEEDIGEMDAEEVFKMTPYFVLYTMIDVMYDKTLIALQKFQKDITILEEKVFSER